MQKSDELDVPNREQVIAALERLSRVLQDSVDQWPNVQAVREEFQVLDAWRAVVDKSQPDSQGNARLSYVCNGSKPKA